MPEDEIVAAERKIMEIAAELKRLRDAANLLNGAQEQITGVLAAVQSVIDATRQFTAVCGPIVAKLASSDIIRKLDDLEASHEKQREALEAVSGKVQAGDEQTRAAMQAAIDTLFERLAQANLADFGKLNAGVADAVGGLLAQTQEVRLEVVSAVQASASLVKEAVGEAEAAAIQRSSEMHTVLAEMHTVLAETHASIKTSDAKLDKFEQATKRRELLLLGLTSVGLLLLIVAGAFLRMKL